MSNYIGATSSMKYYNQDFESYVANSDDKEDCLPVGINYTFMPTEKDDPSNLDKVQYNLKDRFGYLPDRDDR